MQRHVLNRSLAVGAVFYGVSLLGVGVLIAIGFFVFGMVGYVPGLIAVAGLILGVLFMSFPVGWFVARASLKQWQEANLAHVPLFGAVTGAIAVGLPFLLLVVLGQLSSLGSFASNLKMIPANPSLVALLIICGLGALGGALYVWIGRHFESPMFYGMAAAVVVAIVLMGVISFVIILVSDMR